MKIAISDKAVKKLGCPKQGNSITYDTQIPGFGVRITAGGAVSFVLNYRIHGRERRFTIGRYPDWTVLAARNRALELRKGISEGADPLEERQQQRSAPTMLDLSSDYLEQHACVHKRSHSVRDDQRMISAIIAPHLGRLRVAAVSRKAVEKLHASLKPTPYQANRVLSLLSKMFNMAIQWEWIAKNPAQGIPRFHEDKRERWLDAEEMRLIHNALDAYSDQNAADAIRLLMLTGSRKGEVLNAVW